MTRDEHLAWCKRRALEYFDADDLPSAFASMCSDLGKHEETAAVGAAMAPVGLFAVMQDNPHDLRRWIEGFR